MGKRKIFAVIRGAAAVVLSFALLWITGFAVMEIIRGSVVIEDGDELHAGEYVSADLTYIMDVCGVERRADGSAKAYFAVAPVGNKFVIVRFPASAYENVTALEAATMAFLRGEQTSIDFHMPVSGTSKHAPDEAVLLLEQWFEDNGTWMSRAGVIGTVEDYSVYLSDIMIDTGRFRLSYAWTMVWSCASVALLLYGAAEFILAGAGVYDDKKPKKAWDPDV